VSEYKALPLFRRIAYRLYRNPLVMFGIGPAYLFLIQHRLPFGFRRESLLMWTSAMGTNAAIVAASGLMMYLVGAKPFLLVHLPIVLLAASMGVWLFYIQHQFEDTYWSGDPAWQFEVAALEGSSHYVLPAPLRWFSANIGVHHVHHLYSRIPFYKLQAVLRDHPELAEMRRMTFVESLSCLKLRLWDEKRRRLVSFKEAMTPEAANR